MFDIVWKPQPRRIVVRCTGFWTVAIAAAYGKALMREIVLARAASFDVIVDLTDFPPQSMEVAAYVSGVVEEVRRHGLRHLVLVTVSHLKRLQSSRIGGGQQHFFHTIGEAEAWLDAQDARGSLRVALG
jgi:hypothetical protein